MPLSPQFLNLIDRIILASKRALVTPLIQHARDSRDAFRSTIGSKGLQSDPGCQHMRRRFPWTI